MTDILTVCQKICRSFSSGDERLSVLRDVDCEIRVGDRIVLAGPSGSGKTTLLHILGGLDHPTSGEIEWPGLGTIEQLRPRRIGVVFQSPSLFPALTVGQNVDLPAILAGEVSVSGRTAALLSSFGLGGLADKLPEDLSGGQAQRVAMVRAPPFNRNSSWPMSPPDSWTVSRHRSSWTRCWSTLRRSGQPSSLPHMTKRLRRGCGFVGRYSMAGLPAAK